MSIIYDSSAQNIQKYFFTIEIELGIGHRIRATPSTNDMLLISYLYTAYYFRLLAVGGWEMGMGAFSAMVKEEKNMVKFVKTTIEYLKKWKFDGLDLDFEYPGIDWRGSDPTGNYKLLVFSLNGNFCKKEKYPYFYTPIKNNK